MLWLSLAAPAADSRPLRPRWSKLDDERYRGIEAAPCRGLALPPIVAYLLDGDYYVLDSHHRVAAARAMGQVLNEDGRELSRPHNRRHKEDAKASRGGSGRHPPRSRWLGCSPRSRGSSPSPAPGGWRAWRRTSGRLTSSSRPMTSGRSMAPPRKSRYKGHATPNTSSD